MAQLHNKSSGSWRRYDFPMENMPAQWIEPNWPSHSHVCALMTTRQGGVSVSPWDSMNLGDHVGDRAADVQTNRERLAAQIGQRPIFLQQVHGVKSVQLDPAAPHGQLADACWTQDPGVVCTIMVADCLPILLCDAAGSWVAAAHAGWRGLAGSGEPMQSKRHGVLESLWADLKRAGADVSDVMAWLGPCIGPQAFEVGPEVKASFEDGSPEVLALFQPAADGKFMADLAGLARVRLQALGITRVFGNDSSPPWCTVSGSALYFSHRRDSRSLGQSGRMAACIWLDR
jgi:YfiH family protein